MRKQEDTTTVASRNDNNLYRSKPSFIDKIFISFRDFIENAE
jgi:hypothetical protein